MDTQKFKMGWLIVAFDLPVGTAGQRKAATDFRKFLLESGYHMIQRSLYARPKIAPKSHQKHFERLKIKLPPKGSLRAIFRTETQWAGSLVISPNPRKKAELKPKDEQLKLL